MTKLWFKAKQYGWGWTPASWQGYVAIALYIFIAIKIFFHINKTSNSASDILIDLIFPFVLLTFLLIILCYAKGEKPKWRWGKNTETRKDNSE